MCCRMRRGAELLVLATLGIFSVLDACASPAEHAIEKKRLIDVRAPSPEGGPNAVRRHIETLRVAIDGGADIDAADEYGNTPLFNAAFRAAWTYHDWGANDIVAYLLLRGADPNRMQEQMEMTPLHMAALSLYPNVDLVGLLCAAGGNSRTKRAVPEAASAYELSRLSEFAELRTAFENCLPK